MTWGVVLTKSSRQHWGILILIRARENTTATAFLFGWGTGMSLEEEREVKAVDMKVLLKQPEAFCLFLRSVM